MRYVLTFRHVDGEKMLLVDSMFDKGALGIGYADKIAGLNWKIVAIKLWRFVESVWDRSYGELFLRIK